EQKSRWTDAVSDQCREGGSGVDCRGRPPNFDRFRGAGPDGEREGGVPLACQQAATRGLRRRPVHREVVVVRAEIRSLPRSRCSIQWLLRSPPQSFQIRIFSRRCRGPIRFVSLALHTTGFFLPLFSLFGLLSIALCDGGFACSCDGALL